MRVRGRRARSGWIFRLSGTPGKSAGESRPVIDDDSLFLLWSDRFYPADFDDWTLLRTRDRAAGVLSGARAGMPHDARGAGKPAGGGLRDDRADPRGDDPGRHALDRDRADRQRAAPARSSPSRRSRALGTRPCVERRRARLLRVPLRPVRVRRVHLRDGRRDLRAKGRGGGSDLLARVPRTRDALHRPRRARDGPALVVLYRRGERTRQLPVDRGIRRLRGGALRRGARPADPRDFRVLPPWIPGNGRDGRGAFTSRSPTAGRAQAITSTAGCRG